MEITPQTQKGWSRFTRILLLSLAAVLILIAAALTFLWFYLKDYQQAHPAGWGEKLAQAYREADAVTISRYCTNLPAVLKDPDVFRQFLTENVNLNDVFVYEGNAGKEGEILYEINAGDTALATLTVRKTAETSPLGFALYEPVSLVGYPLLEYSLTVPSGVSVQMNGMPLDIGYRIGQRAAASVFEQTETPPFTIDAYHIKDFNYIVDLQATAEEGVLLDVQWDKATHAITIERKLSAETQAEVEAFAKQALKPYLIFSVAEHGARKPILDLVYPGTTLYSSLKNYDNMWGEVYRSDRYENLQIGQFRQYSATEFSCSVGLQYVITYYNGTEKAYAFDKLFYMTKKNGKWQLVAMENR